jgi:hypothetical protein
MFCVRRQIIRNIFDVSGRRLWFICLLAKLCRFQLMLHATIFLGEPFDRFHFFRNGRPSSEVDIRRREIVQALMQAFVVIVFHEDQDLLPGFPRQIVILRRIWFFSV